MNRVFVKLSKGQLTKLAKAARAKTGTTIRLNRAQIVGNVPILLTNRQITRMRKVVALGKGMQLTFSKATMAKMFVDAGIAPLLLAALPVIASFLGPLAAKLGKKIAGGRGGRPKGGRPKGGRPKQKRKAPRQIPGPIVTELRVQSSMTPFKNGTVRRRIPKDANQFVSLKSGSGRGQKGFILPGLTPRVKESITAEVERRMVKRLGQGLFTPGVGRGLRPAGQLGKGLFPPGTKRTSFGRSRTTRTRRGRGIRESLRPEIRELLDRIDPIPSKFTTKKLTVAQRKQLRALGRGGHMSKNSRGRLPRGVGVGREGFRFV